MKQIKQLAAAVLALLTVLSTAVSAAAAEITAPVKDSIDVEKIAFSNPDFIRGMDISSVISLENAGVSFKNGAGETQDIFALLAGNGVNYIRVRIWNHPYDGRIPPNRKRPNHGSPSHLRTNAKRFTTTHMILYWN